MALAGSCSLLAAIYVPVCYNVALRKVLLGRRLAKLGNWALAGAALTAFVLIFSSKLVGILNVVKTQ